MTLPDFLSARVAEDEAEALRDIGKDHSDPAWSTSFQTPDRVLAECAAKRRIVEAASDNTEPRTMALSALTLEWVLAQLALPHADHPDYQPEWRAEA